jgi:hypothetical protein
MQRNTSAETVRRMRGKSCEGHAPVRRSHEPSKRNHATPAQAAFRSNDVVITGASSGIGLATARMAAARRARLVLVARSAQSLEHLTQEVRAGDGEAAGHVMRSSLYTQASLHPALTGAVVAGAGLALRALLRGRSTRHPG